MTTAAEAVLTPGPSGRGPFLEHHPADAVFFPVMVAIVWVLMLAGFMPEVVQRSVSDAPPYPLIIHVHAIVYFGWLSFLALQVALVRTHNVRWHMRMGLAGLLLAFAVVLSGPAAGLTMQMAHQARQPPQFLAIQFASVVGFATMITAGLLLRRHAAAHKRLMLIGTLSLIGAGFGRVIRMVTGAPPPWTLIPAVYLAADVLLLVLALHDLRTRGRLHPVFLPAAGLLVLTQLTAGLLLRWPVWIEFTHRLVAYRST